MGENPRKHITFLVTIKKELDNFKSIKSKIQFFDSFRFLLSLISNFVDGLSGRLHNIKYRDCKSDLEYKSTEQDELFIFNCLKCSKNHKKSILIKNE